MRNPLPRITRVAAVAGYLVVGAALLPTPASATAAMAGDQPATVQSALTNVTPDGCNWVARNWCCQEH